jgi:hypothetical protein
MPETAENGSEELPRQALNPMARLPASLARAGGRKSGRNKSEAELSEFRRHLVSQPSSDCENALIDACRLFQIS